jgi:hypothetical protein
MSYFFFANQCERISEETDPFSFTPCVRNCPVALVYG